MSSEIHLELMIGCPVIAADGHSVGRLQEVQAEWQGADMVITRYLIGKSALLERLSVQTWRTHAGGIAAGYSARWDQVDISNPARPRLTCDVSELEPWPPR